MCETIWKCGHLSLIGPERDAILGSTRVTIDVCLKDRIRDIELLRAKLVLDPMIEGNEEDSYDRLLKRDIRGEHCDAFLYYTTFIFAMTASVEIKIEKKDRNSDFVDVYGSIVASYNNNRRYCNNDDDLKYLETKLFETSLDQPMRVVVENHIKLLRYVVAIPAYAELVVKAHLLDSQGPLASDSKAFTMVDFCDVVETIGCLQVTVRYDTCSSYPRLYKESLVEERLISMYYPGFIPDKMASLGNSMYTWDRVTTIKPITDGVCIVEVFSVYIGGIFQDISSLCGTIKLDNCYKTCLIYNKSPNDHEVLVEDKIASIEVNETISFSSSVLLVIVNLKDPLQKLEVSSGGFEWCIGNVRNGYGLHWFDKRICSLMPGRDGYAAFHYMIISSGIYANIEVTSMGGEPVDLYGRLLARYDGHEYSSYYQKFYQSTLFARPQNRSVKLIQGSSVPLSKSMVALPIKSSLVVKADLRAIRNDSREEALSDMLTFPIDTACTKSTEIRGNFCVIQVSVKFSFE